MAPTLGESLRGRPLFFEPVPPSARSPPARTDALVEAVAEILRRTPRVTAVDVPELVDENHDGRPYYRSQDPRDFAHRLAERSGVPGIVSKVVAHLDDATAVRRWAEITAGAGVQGAVLVGGSSRYIPYPGPPVAEANRICRPVWDAVGGRIGNIAIPSRTGEAHRMLAKTRAGASFFTTQIVFDAAAPARLIAEYATLCRAASVPPATVLVSFAPLADEIDAGFVRWLGAEIPEPTERAILSGEESSAGARSVAHALAVWARIETLAVGEAPEVPLGANVEQISARHLATAAGMLEAFDAAFAGPGLGRSDRVAVPA